MDGTISRTTDLGKSWSVVSSASSRNSSSQSLAAIGNTILACTSYYDYAASGDGIDWIPTIFASNVFAVGDSIAYTISNSGACASRDGGMTWTTFRNANFPTSGLTSGLAAVGSNLFVGTAPIVDIDTSEGIYLSRDNGASWHRSFKSPLISALAANGRAVYAINGGTLWSSVDTGVSWQMFTFPTLPPPAGSPYVFAVAFRYSEIFVGSSAGVLRSMDGGVHWAYNNTGLQGFVNAMAVHGKNVYAGTSAGIFVLNQEDTTWSSVNTGLPTASNAVSSIVADSTEIFAVVGGAFWKRPLSEIETLVVATTERRPTAFSLSQNYPNPFNPTTTIEYTIARKGMVTLTVYDLLGRVANILVANVQSPGKYTATFNASRFASGIYFYRLNAGDYLETRKLIVIK